MSLKNISFILSTLIIFSISNLVVQAEEKTLYKKIDKNGRIIFTDKPIPGAKKIVVNTSKNVLSTPKSLRKGNKEEEASDNENKESDSKSIAYSVFAIDKPSKDEAVRANNGNLYVIAALTPQLAREHSIRLMLNGAQVGEDQKVPYFSLTNIDRGTHQLSAQIYDDTTGELLQTTAPLEFHLLRASALMRNKRP